MRRKLSWHQDEAPTETVLASRPLEFVVMGILGLLSKKTNRKLVNRRRNGPLFKNSSNIPVFKKQCATCCVDLFQSMGHTIRDSCLSAYRQRSKALEQIFPDVCTLIGVNRLTNSVCNPGTNGQAESYNITIFARLRRYVAQHQHDLDLFLQPITYAYNTQVP